MELGKVFRDIKVPWMVPIYQQHQMQHIDLGIKQGKEDLQQVS